MKKLLLKLVILFYLCIATSEVSAQSVGDYRTRAAGAWSSTTVWQTYQILIGWQNTTVPPTNSNGAISILHAITISGGATVNTDQTTISTGGSLTLSDGTLNLYNGSGNDLIITGGTFTMNNASSALNAPSGFALVYATSGTVALSNGTIAAGMNINTYNATALTITQASSSNLTLNGQITNYSTAAVWTATSATFTFGSNGFLYNGIGGVFTIAGSGTNNIGSSSSTSRSGIITNAGTFSKTTSAVLNVNASSFDNTGTIQLITVASNFYLHSAGDIFGILDANIAGSNFYYNTASKNFYAGLTLKGSGTHHINASITYNISGTSAYTFGGVINFNSPAAIPADINITGATLNCNKGVSFDGPGYSVFTYSPQINVATGGSFSTSIDDTLSIMPYFGTTAVPSTLTINNNITIGGPMSVNSICSMQGSGTAYFYGDLLANAGLINNSSFQFVGTSAQSVSGSSGRISTTVINNATDVTFSTNHNLFTSLTFTKGKISISDKLFIPGTASISGVSATKYFTGNGYLKRNLSPSSSYTFPVGNSTGYLPATLTTAAGFVADTIWMRIESTKFSSSYNGSFAATGQPLTTHVVEPVWRIVESTSGGTSFSNLTLQWNGSNETYLFARNTCGVVSNGGGAWSAVASGAAGGSNPYTRSTTTATIPVGTLKTALFGIADNSVVYSSNRITSDRQTRNVCAGGSFTFFFSVLDSNSMSASNVFTAQLSDANGSFASPIAIGSVVAKGGRNLTCTIPAGTAVGHYSVRVVSSNTPMAEQRNVFGYYEQRLSVRSFCYSCPGAYSTVSCGTNFINYVSLNYLYHASACESVSAFTYSSYGYEDYESDGNSYNNTATIVRGRQEYLYVTTTASSIISVWIDYNRNGVYEASEWNQVTTASTANAQAQLIFTVPLTASLGYTGMRIRNRAVGSPNGSGDACTTFGSGETEDYYIYIADQLSNSSHTPTTNNRCVTASTSPTLTYNSVIKKSSVTAANFQLQGSISGIKPATLTGGGTTTITINPTQNFEPGEVVSVAASGKSIIDTSLQTSTEYCYQFTTAASVAPKTFKKHALTGSGASVINNYSADINNDGFTDLIEVNSSAATSYISISRGNGNGTFLTPTYIYTSATPYSTAIADYDLDGDMDIAIGYSAQYKVDIYYNNGTGSFTGPSNITTRYRARIVLPFYLLDNEAPSILCANTSDSAISVIQNKGNGVIGDLTRTKVGSPIQSMVTGDFNLDGLLDVAISCSDNTIKIYEFYTRKSFALRNSFSCGGTTPFELKTADLNGDGELDLVWSNFSSANIGYALGGSAFTFGTVSLASTNANPFRLALADYDGDCDIDAACSLAGTADFNFFENTAGVLSLYNNPKGNNSAGYIVSITSADYDEDGDIDIVGSSVAYSSKTFLENASYTIQTGSVSGPLCNNPSISTSWVVSDSLPSSNLFYVQLSDASGSFASPTYLDTIAGQFSGSATVVIPTVTAGTGYRIRVTSNFSGITYFDNGTNISIGASPANPNINFVCSGTSTILSATGGTTYTWSPSTYLSAATGSPVTATPAVTQTITMIAKDIAGCSSTARTASVGPTCYCYPNYANNTCSNDYIASVQFNTLNYSNSTCGGNDNNTTINYYTTATPNVATDLNRLSTYTLSLLAGAANPEGFGVWIDYNQDGDFADAGEFIYSSPTTANQTFTSPISVPGTATLGITRMRVMISRGTLVTSGFDCSTTLSRGETQDFYIRISGCVPPTVYTVSGGGTICSSQTGSVALSNSTAGVTYALYRNAVATGTTLSGTGTALSFTGITSAGTYSIYGTNSLGCKIKMQDSVSITVISLPTTANAGSDQTKCGQTSTTLTANAPTSGTGSWTIVSGSGGSFSATNNPSATFTAAAGSTNTLRWTISNSPCTASSDDVIISFPLNPTTASAGPDQLALCGLTSATLAANTPSVGTGTWTVVSGTGGSFSNAASASSTFIGTSGNTYTLRWTITNSTCTASSDDVQIAFPKNPTTANAGTSQTLCGTTATTLAANTPTAGSGLWTIFSGTGGTLTNPSSPTSGFSGVAGNTYVLFWTISNSPCTASSDSMVVYFPQNPTTADAGADQLKCGLTVTTLAGNTPTVGTGVWSKVSGIGGSFGNTTSPTSTFTGTAGNSYTLRWTISNSICTTSSNDVNIDFPLNPTTASAGNDTNICNGSIINLKANTPIIGSGSWSILSGSCSITSTTSPTSTASAFTNNTITSLVWSITNGACPVSRDTVRINSNASFCAATLADFTANKTTACTGEVITYTDLSSNATSWSWNFGSNASPATANTQGPHAVTYSTTGNKTISLTATGPGGSNTKTKTNYVTIITVPGSATGITGNTSICAGTSSVAYSITAVATATNYVWTVPTGASIVSGAGTNSITVDYSGSAVSGNVSVYASNACGNGATTNLAVNVSASPTTSNAGPDQTSLCGTTTANLAANTPTTGTGAWSIVSGGTGTFSNSTSANSTFTGTAGATYTLRWTISNAPCAASTDDVLIKFNQNPSTAAAGLDQTALCGLTSATLAGNTPSIGSGSWTILSGSGGSFSNSNLPNSIFVGTAGNSYTLQWTISNSPCAASSDNVLISFPLNPSTSSAGTDQTLCGATSATLAGSTPTVGNGSWSIVSGGSGNFSSATNPSATFSPISGTVFTLRWTISNSPCSASSDDVVISFLQNPTTANAGSDQTVCGSNSAALAANVPTSGNGTWAIVSGGSGTFSNTTSATSTFTGTAGSSYVLSWTISTTNCGASSDNVSISFPQNPSTANAGLDQNLCGVNSATLAASVPSIGTGSWSIQSGGTGNFSNAASANSTFTGIAGNTYTLRWTVSNSPCTASSDDVIISFPLNPTVSAAGSDQEICGITSATLAANTPLTGTGSWSKISGTGGSFASTSNPTTIFNGTAGVVYILRWTITTATCGTTSDDVQVSFYQNPSSANAGLDQTLCGQTTANLAAVAPTIGTGTWSIVSGGAGSFSSVNSATSSFNGTAGNTYQLRWTISNATCISNSDDVTVSFPINPTTADAGPAQYLCGANSATLAANIPIIGSGSWSIVSGGSGSFTSATNANTVFTGTAGNIYTLRWTITNAPCGSNFDEVQISFPFNPSVSNAGSDTTICNGSSIVLNATNPIVGTGTWSIVSGSANLSNINSPISSATVFAPDTNTVLVWTVSANSCPDSRDTVIITSNTAVCIVTVADFIADTTATCIGSSVVFTDLSNQATSWSWNFGAGATPATITGAGPHTVTYSTAGQKTVTLTVSGPGGTDVKTKTNYINIQQIPAAASTISGATTICEGQTNVQYTVPVISDALAYNWLLPNGASITSANQNNIVVSYATGAQSGSISVEGTNGCGTGAASTLAITVNQYPSAAGLISGLDTICDGSSGVTYTVGNIANATSYYWILPSGVSSSTGTTITTSPSINLDFQIGLTGGIIQVFGQNSCGDGDTSTAFTFVIAPYPSAAGTIIGSTLVSACSNQLGITYSVPVIANALSYSWTLPPLATLSSGAGTNSIQVDFDVASSSGNIEVSGVNACGNGPSSLLAVNFTPIPVTEICYATVDSATVQSILYWQRPPQSYVDSFVVYSDATGGSNLIRIGALANSAAVPTTFIDPFSSPIINAVTYQIATKDSCNNQLSLSATVVHKTINLNGTLGWSGPAKLYWNEYLGIADPGRTYTVLRDTTGIGAFNDTLAKGILPAPIMNYTDITSSQYPLCRYVIVMEFSTTCDPTQRIMLSKNTSRSNIKNRAAMLPDNIIPEFENENSVVVYPNPAKNLVHISIAGTSKEYQLSLISIVGQKIISTEVMNSNGYSTTTDLSLKSVAPGIYFVLIESENGFSKVMKLKVE
ncbi:MAG TPA: GEVED domain-containing protein [Bacteroidia bacterium]|nr:GEVED domain-containing protein [Bacteroidia bacterium]